MKADGLTLADIANVQTHLTMLRVNDFVPTKRATFLKAGNNLQAAPDGRYASTQIL